MTQKLKEMKTIGKSQTTKKMMKRKWKRTKSPQRKKMTHTAGPPMKHALRKESQTTQEMTFRW